eukprot:TRINITY_DN1629_c0_g1_i6.p1 TRINITY_DN1629_c0_g1~~TRINITY_DN1629_c0_g1_i6.p1  ORF type:complete len:104 (+),score=15.67 TRINITY_DN1629_c0_g1_i6:298-609(+)
MKATERTAQSVFSTMSLMKKMEDFSSAKPVEPVEIASCVGYLSFCDASLHTFFARSITFDIQQDCAVFALYAKIAYGAQLLGDIKASEEYLKKARYVLCTAHV